MTWLETLIGHAPSDVAVALSRQDQRLARAAMVFHADPEVVDTIAKTAKGIAASTAQLMRRTGQDPDRFARDRAANVHTDPDVLAQLCWHARPTVRLAAWTNPSTLDDDVIDSISVLGDEVLNLANPQSYSTLSARAGAIVAVHPAATAQLTRYQRSAVRAGAAAFGRFDADLADNVSASTQRTTGFRLNPTVSQPVADEKRWRLDEILDGRSCEVAVAAMSHDQARAAVSIGSGLLDLALAQQFPYDLLEEAYQFDDGCGRSHLTPIVLATACRAAPDAWMLAMGGQSTARVALTRPFSPQLDTAAALGWHGFRPDKSLVVRDSGQPVYGAFIADALGDNPLVWQLWGRLMDGVPLDDTTRALDRIPAALGAIGGPTR